jgi:hypothetical protein
MAIIRRREEPGGRLSKLLVLLLTCLAFFIVVVNFMSVVSSTVTGSQANEQQSEGWHNIQVFYGSDKLVDRSEYVAKKDSQNQEWFSQVRQDEIVSALFQNQRGLYFVELAANHAIYLSNTLGLEKNLQWKGEIQSSQFHWRVFLHLSHIYLFVGLCIEANPKYWYSLSYRDCQVVAAAVGKNRMEQVKFNFGGEELGGIVDKGGLDGAQFKYEQKKHGGIVGRSASAQYTQQKDSASTVYTVPLVEILQRNNAPLTIDFMSLDVEGAERYIMEAFPFDHYLIKVMSVERPDQNLQRLLMKQGYKAIAFVATFGETLWAHTSIMDSLDLQSLKRFDLPVISPGFHSTAEDIFIPGAYGG